MNKKGFICVLVPVVATHIIAGAVVFQALFGIVGLAAVWHIPAWTKAKHDHTEASYQSQAMWPQVQMNHLAQGNPGNGGNFAGGNSGQVK